MRLVNLSAQVLGDLQRACVSQPRRAGLDRGAVKLGHARGRRAGTWGIRKNMQPSQVAFIHQTQRIFKMSLSFGRKSCDYVGAKGHVRSQCTGLFGKANGVVSQVAPLHPFQDQIVAMLQAQM